MSVTTSTAVCGACGQVRNGLAEVIAHAAREHGLSSVDVMGTWVLDRFWGEPRRWNQRDIGRAWLAMHNLDSAAAARVLVGSERVAEETVADVAELQEEFWSIFSGAKGAA